MKEGRLQMKNRRVIQRLLMAAGCLAVAGCSNLTKPIDPGAINHVVLISLTDPSSSAELEADCERLLKPIPAVRTYACGGHHDIGRTNIASDYSVGILVSFEDEAGYQAYLVDPRHVELVEKWKSRWSGITIYDIGNSDGDAPDA